MCHPEGIIFKHFLSETGYRFCHFGLKWGVYSVCLVWDTIFGSNVLPQTLYHEEKKNIVWGVKKVLYAINSIDIYWLKSQHITGSETGYKFWDSGLKYGMEKRIFWSEIGQGFSGPGSTPPPKNIMSKPPPPPPIPSPPHTHTQFQPSLRLSTWKKQILLYPVLQNCPHYSYLIGAWKFTGIILFSWVKSIFGFGNQFLEIDIIWLPHAALGLNCGQHFWTCSSEWGHRDLKKKGEVQDGEGLGDLQ